MMNDGIRNHEFLYPEAPGTFHDRADADLTETRHGGLEDEFLKRVRAELLSHHSKTIELLRQFKPPRTDVHYVLEGSQYAMPVSLLMPKDTIGGMWIENSSGATAHVFLHSGGVGEPFLDIPSGTFKAVPVNPWDNTRTILLALDSAQAGRVRVILSSDSLGPAEGVLVATQTAQNTGVAGTLINAIATAGTNYQNAAALGNNLTTLTLFLSVAGATTITVEVSPDDVNWYAATVANSEAAAGVDFSGAGSTTVNLTPAPFVRVRSSNGVQVAAQYVGG